MCSLASAAWAQSSDHKMVLPKDLQWSDVPSPPKGAKGALIEGPMNEAVPFTLRLKFPANCRIPPHWHAAVERVTVLSGTFHSGLGEKIDQKKTHALTPGGMMIMQPKTPHFAWTKSATVVQIHGSGPWAVN